MGPSLVAQNHVIDNWLIGHITLVADGSIIQSLSADIIWDDSIDKMNIDTKIRILSSFEGVT